MSSRSPVRRLALGRALSGTGNGIASVALSFLVYDRTDSAIWLSASLLLTFGLTGFLAPFAGKIADQYNRRLVMICADLASLTVWALLIPVSSPPLLLAMGFIASVVSLPFGFAASAAIPNLVERDELSWANGLMAAGGNTARLAGPAIGGVLYVLGGAGLAFGVNAISFALSALLVWSVRGIPFSAREDDEQEEPSSAFEGFRIIRDDGVLLWLTITWTCMWLAMNVAFVADPPLAQGFGVGALGFGLIDTSFGIGALVGSLAATRVVGRFAYSWVALGCLGVAVGWCTIAITPWFALVLVASAIAASIDAVGEVAGYGLIQQRVDDAVRGRVFAAQTTAGLCINVVGFLIIGPLVQVLGPQAVYGLGGLLALAATGLFVVAIGRRYGIDVFRPNAGTPPVTASP